MGPPVRRTFRKCQKRIDQQIRSEKARAGHRCLNDRSESVMWTGYASLKVLLQRFPPGLNTYDRATGRIEYGTAFRTSVRTGLF